MGVYKQFPQSNLIREWDLLLKMDRKDVETLYEEWKLIHKENNEKNTQMYNEKNDKINEVAKQLKDAGIDVYKYTKGIFPKRNGYQAWFKNNIVEPISKKYPYYSNGIPTAHCETKEVNGIKLYNNQSPTNILELFDRITWQYNSKIKEVQKVDKLLIKSIEYANKHNIEIEEYSSDAIIYVIEEYAKKQYLKENVPDGTEVYLKHECSECNSYSMGERRCSCGNRRIGITVEGNIIEGFYHYPEAY